MGWFDEQIRQRIKSDDEIFTESMQRMAQIVMGKGVFTADTDDSRTRDAVDEILKYYHIRHHELPENRKDINELLEYLMRPSGIMRRTVLLEENWYKNGIGPLLATRKEDGSVVALVPKGFSGYDFYDVRTGVRRRLNKETARLFDETAICFYKPLPLKKLRLKDLFLYIVGTLSAMDFVAVAAATLVVTLVGMLLPKVNNIIFSTVVENNDVGLLLSAAALLVGVTVSSTLFGVVRSMFMERIQVKMDMSVQAASMMRVLSLPPAFFKEYSAGELSSRVQQLNALCSMLANSVLSTGLTSVFSLVYVAQIFTYTPALVVPALLVILATVIFSAISTLVNMKITRQRMEFEAKESGMNYALISGVQKIRLSGAEKRAFAQWANTYAKAAKLEYDPPVFVKISSVISTGITLVGMVIMYFFAVESKVGVADYFAFNTAYGMVMGAFMALSGMAITIANIRPVYQMVKPILEEVPEVSEGKRVVTSLSGGIELNNISFRYQENMPLVLDDISLKIRPGQYVAVVGATGCGKSTLMRLMLGFEMPGKGAIYYDGKDLSTLDQRSLRRNIGVVMQNGKLFQGDIYSNIVISAPWLTVDDAWKAADLAGMGDDIRDMPMGMNTLIAEGSGGISGGQRQRIMIARAIAPRPKILMFDEATSALDNLTQKVVSDSLNQLKCTRIVIAHRLSTIRQCDRIIVLEKGKIIEDGSYDALIKQNGYFAALVARQRLDDVDYVGKTTLY